MIGLPKDLGEGLYIAATGMGLVFLTLIALMVILFALKKLFPAEEIEATYPAQERPTSIEVPQQAEVAQIPVATPELSPIVVPAENGVPGAKIAAIAVAMYLAMEQEEQAAMPTATAAAKPQPEAPRERSDGGTAPTWENQGHRPQPYGQRTQSPYTPRNRQRG